MSFRTFSVIIRRCYSVEFLRINLNLIFKYFFKLKNILRSKGLLLFPLSLILILVTNVLGPDINIYSVGVLFLIAEVGFSLTLMLILLASGIQNIKLKDLIKRDYTKINFKKSIVRFLWSINRIVWLIPLFYILYIGWGHLNWVSIIILIIEILLTIFIGINVDNKLTPEVIIRQATLSDIELIERLELEVWGEQNGAKREHLLNRVKLFPEGNFIAEKAGEIIGYVSCIFMDYDIYSSENKNSWYHLTTDGFCSNHRPDGKDLFGVSLGTSKRAPTKTSKLLLYEIMKLGIKKNINRWLLGSRVPRYYKYSDKFTIQEYVFGTPLSKGTKDPEIRFYQNVGLKALEIVPDYFRDSDSLNYGVIVGVSNPFRNKPFVHLFIKLILKLPFDASKLVSKFL